MVKLLACGARGPGFDSRPRHLIFRDWLSPASKSRYSWNIAKSTLILKTTNQPSSIFYKVNHYLFYDFNGNILDIEYNWTVLHTEYIHLFLKNHISDFCWKKITFYSNDLCRQKWILSTGMNFVKQNWILSWSDRIHFVDKMTFVERYELCQTELNSVLIKIIIVDRNNFFSTEMNFEFNSVLIKMSLVDRYWFYQQKWNLSNKIENKFTFVDRNHFSLHKIKYCVQNHKCLI